MSVLVTGGCGYIGAHVVRALRDAGETVVVVDDLSTGISERILPLTPTVMDLATQSASQQLGALMREQHVDAVIHLAALKQVAESVAEPTRYFRANVNSLGSVLEASRDAGVRNVVFSSSAAVYGDVSRTVSEDAPTNPVNPYGQSKLVGEWLLADAAQAYGLSTISLRYFNVAGSAAVELGDHAIANLVPMVFDRLSAGLPPRVFGGDYDTADGSCVRDFIHVSDLAEAHLAALAAVRAEASGSHSVYNVGTGRGISVLEMIELIIEVTGSSLVPEIVGRRAGDPALVVADSSKLRRELQWTPTHDARNMVESAWRSFSHRPGRNRPA